MPYENRLFTATSRAEVFLRETRRASLGWESSYFRDAESARASPGVQACDATDSISKSDRRLRPEGRSEKIGVGVRTTVESLVCIGSHSCSPARHWWQRSSPWQNRIKLFRISAPRTNGAQ